LKEKSTSKGVLKYRMPNVVEGFEFLSMIGSISSGKDIFKMKANFISKIEPLVDYSSCEYKDWNELISDKETMFHPLSEIAQEIFDDITGVLVKKI
jgi:hypothetical protein